MAPAAATASPVVAISAPGKVLFAGGFLVLDRQHTGLVFGLDARIHVLIEPVGHQRRLSGTGRDEVRVMVRSPQFDGAVWSYAIRSGDGEVSVVQVVDEVGDGQAHTKNKFVETALRYALTYLAYATEHSSEDRQNGHAGQGRVLGKGDIQITVLADDDYYSSSSPSQESDDAPALQQHTAQSRRFKSFNTTLPNAHKTGLGSSAALTTALVGAILEFYLSSDTTISNDSSTNHPSSHSETTNSFSAVSPSRKSQIHNLAQAAHSAAQGKVGSGFDVAAAVFGSCLYRRFSPAVLEQIGEADSEGFSGRLYRCVENVAAEDGEGLKWNAEVKENGVAIPEGLRLVLCDVDCGSETPSMVRKMLQWRKARPDESERIWGNLLQSQEELCRELTRLSKSMPTNSQQTDTTIDNRYARLKQIISVMRHLVQQMTASSGVPVEPPPITALLDHVSAIRGIIGGVAPGAGGYDAVALLVEDRPEIIKELEGSLEGWKWTANDNEAKIAEEGPEIGKVRLLGVRQASEGVWREEVEDGGRYAGWR
ncbi:putative phosphomevalonate kinase [Cyphellophora attinorum]|uniref:Phosphomevalonate kinase n=1 Tax=Cyphellophora attinorum TaxID=1664694 RepID=A0A0N1H9X9_9EURO|nr:putative phosphomevalonate kinase [Phialophora attinorum]KPI39162.1 putative phosphomevalonate kinase [Phialophora attinorum]